MTSSQVQVSETPPMSQQDLEGLKDENGLYAGKFKTVEDLANSYKELEGKLGSVTEEDQVSESTEKTTGVPEGYEDYYQEDGTVDYNSVNENYGEILGELFKENSIDPYKIAAEFDKNEGEIPEEMYQSLLDAGLSANAVDSYLKGVAVERGYIEGEEGTAEELAQEEVKGIRDSIGGDEAYSKMVSWALDNLSKPEIEAFNEATNTMSGPQLSMMVQGLYTRYQNAMGVEPSLYSGKPASSGPTPYRSTAEVVAAMSDPRYGKDVTYTEDVQRRLGGSDVFG
jgi:predicted transcriptional regulator